MRAIQTVLAVAVAGILTSPAEALAGQNRSESQTAQQPAPATAPADQDFHAPLAAIGWTYGSIIRNGFTGNVTFSPGRKVSGQDMTIWRGLQIGGTVGSRGFEVGAGWNRFALAQLPGGYKNSAASPGACGRIPASWPMAIGTPAARPR